MMSLTTATEQQVALPVAAVVAACALIFTVASFWWLNARQGRLQAWEPMTFSAAVTASRSRLRFPIVVYNTGAKPIVIRDLRLSFPDENSMTAPLPWTTLRTQLRPTSDDSLEMPAVFAVPGRAAEQLFIEFGTSKPRYFVPEARSYRVVVEALLGREDKWHSLVTFTWQAGRLVHPVRYITYRNSSEVVEGEGPDKAAAGLDAVAAQVVGKGGTPEARAPRSY
ncbi:hypothetical protein ACWCQB_38285 [Streptomyces hirsutus]